MLSAKLIIIKFLESISLIYKAKSVSEIVLPCGTPDKIENSNGFESIVFTKNYLSIRKLSIHEIIYDGNLSLSILNKMPCAMFDEKLFFLKLL